MNTGFEQVISSCSKFSKAGFKKVIFYFEYYGENMQRVRNDLYRVYDHSKEEWLVQMFIAKKGDQILVAEHGDSGWLVSCQLGN